MEKIAFVCVNYGPEILGGSQYFTRLIAERLTSHYEVEVLTSSSIDARTWANYYDIKPTEINGVLVRRFNVNKNRAKNFGEIVASYQKDIFDDTYENDWIESVGPHSPSLINYIKENANEYKVFIFVTYEYYHSVKGIPEVKDKVIFIPTAHDCPLIKKNLFKGLFNMPKAFVYLTEEEKQLCHHLFHNQYIPNRVLGVGVDIPKISNNDFKQKYNLKSYILYLGRVEIAKGCQELFNYFLEYKKRNENDLKLVIVGKGPLPIPEDENIINVGFVDEETKFKALEGADLLVLPSKYESLSMVVLESMAVKTPVLVSKDCAVLKGHCDKSNGGLYYNSYAEFEKVLNFYPTHPNIYKTLCENAYKYVNDNYNWNKIISEYINLINNIF